MITKSIISRNQNGQIEITSYDDKDNYDDIVTKQITSRGLYILDVVEGVVEKPTEHRDCWDYKNGKIEVDAVKVQAKEAAIVVAHAEHTAVLQKLGISAEDAEILLKKGGVK